MIVTTAKDSEAVFRLGRRFFRKACGSIHPRSHARPSVQIPYAAPALYASSAASATRAFGGSLKRPLVRKEQLSALRRQERNRPRSMLAWKRRWTSKPSIAQCMEKGRAALSGMKGCVFCAAQLTFTKLGRAVGISGEELAS
jgi:hypothetical protein